MEGKVSEHSDWAQDEGICPCGEQAGPDFRYGLCDKHAKETPAPTLLRMGATFGRLLKREAELEAALAAANARADAAEAINKRMAGDFRDESERRDKAEAALAAANARADAATAKAEQYERDWYAAKNDFGTAMAKSREALAAARREYGLLSALLAESYDYVSDRRLRERIHAARASLASPADGDSK